MANKFFNTLVKNYQHGLNLIIGLAFLVAAIILWPQVRDFSQKQLQNWQWQYLRHQNETSSSEIQIDLHINSEEMLSLSAVDQLNNNVIQPLLQRQLTQLTQNQSLLATLKTLLNARSDGELLALSSTSTIDSPDVINDSQSVPVLPAVDTALPAGTWLISDKIGLNAAVDTSGDLEKGLEKGVVMVTDLGTIGQTSIPVVMAAHRYGYLKWWDSNYGRQNSFYYLPELTVGDRIEVIQDQRRWYYEIYSSSEGTEISDYDADLILYTCEALTGDNRYFRYARLIDPSEY